MYSVLRSTCAVIRSSLSPSLPRCSVCAILVVEGASAYNDSVTAVFRDVARRGLSGSDGRGPSGADGRGPVLFGYVDRSIQLAFLESFGLHQQDVGQCSNGELGRLVCFVYVCVTCTCAYWY